MYVIANGGMSNKNIKNTLDAILLTKNASYIDGVLIDIRLTLDNEIVLMENDNLEVATLGKGKISNMLYKDVKRVKFPSKIFKYYIPTLKEVLSRYRADKIIILNLHNMTLKNQLFAHKVLEVINNYPQYHFYLETTDKELLEYLISITNKYPIGYKNQVYLNENDNRTYFCDVFYKIVNDNINSYSQIMTHVINEVDELREFLKSINLSKIKDLFIISDNPKRIKDYISLNKI